MTPISNFTTFKEIHTFNDYNNCCFVCLLFSTNNDFNECVNNLMCINCYAQKSIPSFHCLINHLEQKWSSMSIWMKKTKRFPKNDIVTSIWHQKVSKIEVYLFVFNEFLKNILKSGRQQFLIKTSSFIHGSIKLRANNDARSY